MQSLEFAPTIQQLPRKTFVGHSMRMTFDTDQTAELWQGFMPRREAVRGRMGQELYSIQQFEDGFFDGFDPTRTYQKWAAVEVDGTHTPPNGMEQLTADGLYAVFIHRGPPSSAPATFGYIFNEWLPDSGYEIDERPHLGVMDHRYKPTRADSEEELWIPIRKAG